MVTIADQLDLYLFPDSPVWHIATTSDMVLCDGRRVPVKVGTLEVGLDSRVVSHRGKAVCARCRRMVRR